MVLVDNYFVSYIFIWYLVFFRCLDLVFVFFESVGLELVYFGFMIIFFFCILGIIVNRFVFTCSFCVRLYIIIRFFSFVFLVEGLRDVLFFKTFFLDI